jgi:hypothetical protein
VNDAPELPVLGDVVVGVFTTVTVTNTATDVDSAAAGFGYTLLSGTGAIIATNGVITWTPKTGPSTNLFTTIVSDGGEPLLSATNTFYVVVTNGILPPVIEAIEVVEGFVTLRWSAMANGVYRLQYQDEVGGTNWMDALPDVTATGATATGTNFAGDQPLRFYRVLLVP